MPVVWTSLETCVAPARACARMWEPRFGNGLALLPVHCGSGQGRGGLSQGHVGMHMTDITRERFGYM